MINNPPPFKGLNIWISVIMPIEGRGLLIMGLHYSTYIQSSDTCHTRFLKYKHQHGQKCCSTIAIAVNLVVFLPALLSIVLGCRRVAVHHYPQGFTVSTGVERRTEGLGCRVYQYSGSRFLV